MQFDITLERDGLQGIEKKTDAEVILDWLGAAHASSPAQTEPFLHLLWEKLTAKIKAAAEAGKTSVELSDEQFVMVKLALIRANIPAEARRMYVQLLKKIGIDLEL